MATIPELKGAGRKLGLSRPGPARLGCPPRRSPGVPAPSRFRRALRRATPRARRQSDGGDRPSQFALGLRLPKKRREAVARQRPEDRSTSGEAQDQGPAGPEKPEKEASPRARPPKAGLVFAVPDLRPHPPLFAADLPPTLARFLRSHRTLRIGCHLFAVSSRLARNPAQPVNIAEITPTGQEGGPAQRRTSNSSLPAG